MRRPPRARHDDEPKKTGSAGGPSPTLPAWKAFVVQFTHDAGKKSGVFAGRVEHLTSGRRERFASAAELKAALERMLEEIGSEP
jgi:hypothetical protein